MSESHSTIVLGVLDFAIFRVIVERRGDDDKGDANKGLKTGEMLLVKHTTAGSSTRVLNIRMTWVFSFSRIYERNRDACGAVLPPYTAAAQTPFTTAFLCSYPFSTLAITPFNPQYLFKSKQ